MGVALRPIDGSFAREVTGMALWQPIDGAQAGALRAAFAENPLLVFRRQALDDEELMTFGHAVGTPSPYAEAHWQSGYPEIVFLSNVRTANGAAVGGLGNRELTWHTDQSYYAEPVTGCFLYGIMLPKTGGRTSWADLYAAYEGLPSALRRVVDGAVATFSYAARAGSYAGDDDGHKRAARIAVTPDVKHRLVNVHPGTGRKALFIDPKTAIAIDGMPDDEARDLLDELERHATRPENVYHHEWRVGDLVLWDNGVLLHRRDTFPQDEMRLVKRMIIKLPVDRHIVPPVVA